jgi:hypothetical protein
MRCAWVHLLCRNCPQRQNLSVEGQTLLVLEVIVGRNCDGGHVEYDQVDGFWVIWLKCDGKSHS